MYQRIVVPVDESNAAAAAVEEAIGLTRLTGASLQLLHILDVSRSGLASVGMPGMEFATYGESREARLEEAQQLLQGFAQRVSQAGLTCETRLIEENGADPARQVLDAAQAWQAELIVMGTHGYTGLAHLLFGSVAEKVVHQSSIPVLLIRRQDDDD